uniref:CLPTM1 regulator of GABA type A receptor forward trafficking n=1 Tax=Cyprinodon variegatus TaxID=28743 RepID=A0A3Q2CFI3_CYPVA
MATQGSDSSKPSASNGEVSSNGSAATAEGQTVQTAENAQDPQQQQQAPNAWQVIKGVLFIFIIWAISSWFRRGPSTPDPNTPAGAPRVPSRNLFPKDTLMCLQDLYVYVSQEEVFTDFNNTDALFWFNRDLVYGDWTTGESGDGCYHHNKELEISEKVQQNGSLYIHVFFTKSGFHPDPKRKGQYRRLATVHSSRLNKFKRRKFLKTKNLLTGETEADPEMIKRAESHGPVEIISHWHPNLTINMVDDHTAWVKGSVPPPLDQVKFDAVSGDYYPIVYFNDYWNLQKDYYPINESLTKLPLRLTYCPLSLWRWQLYAAQNARSPWNFLPEDTYEQSDEDQDSVKLDRENKIAGILPRLIFKDKSTYVESSTKIYDDMAFRYLSWLLYPLFGCYAVYSLLYVEHKGWYSWVLSMLYGFLLTFFITMTPQLFINYKMKSVAHLPWRMLTYKALNTFIDDLFAFVIKMPMMYRIGCLRDVVFFIYLYQRWIYRVDPNRVNEFGTSGLDHTQNNTAETPAVTDKPEGEKKND